MRTASRTQPRFAARRVRTKLQPAFLIDYFQTTTEFTKDISGRTRADYKQQIKIIEQRFGDFPSSALKDPHTSGIFKEWRDDLATRSLRQADYA